MTATNTINIEELAGEVAESWLAEHFGGSPEEEGETYYNTLTSGRYLWDGDLRSPITEFLVNGEDVKVEDCGLSEEEIENLTEGQYDAIREAARELIFNCSVDVKVTAEISL